MLRLLLLISAVVFGAAQQVDETCPWAELPGRSPLALPEEQGAVFVDPVHGIDSDSCGSSATSACLSLCQALRFVSSSGHHLLLLPGVYSGGNNWPGRANTSAVLAGVDRDLVRINVTQQGELPWLTNAADWLLENVTFTGHSLGPLLVAEAPLGLSDVVFADVVAAASSVVSSPGVDPLLRLNGVTFDGVTTGRSLVEAAGGVQAAGVVSRACTAAGYVIDAPCVDVAGLDASGLNASLVRLGSEVPAECSSTLRGVRVTDSVVARQLVSAWTSRLLTIDDLLVDDTAFDGAALFHLKVGNLTLTRVVARLHGHNAGVGVLLLRAAACIHSCLLDGVDVSYIAAHGAPANDAVDNAVLIEVETSTAASIVLREVTLRSCGTRGIVIDTTSRQCDLRASGLTIDSSGGLLILANSALNDPDSRAAVDLRNISTSGPSAIQVLANGAPTTLVLDGVRMSNFDLFDTNGNHPFQMISIDIDSAVSSVAVANVDFGVLAYPRWIRHLVALSIGVRFGQAAPAAHAITVFNVTGQMEASLLHDDARQLTFAAIQSHSPLLVVEAALANVDCQGWFAPCLAVLASNARVALVDSTMHSDQAAGPLIGCSGPNTTVGIAASNQFTAAQSGKRPPRYLGKNTDVEKPFRKPACTYRCSEQLHPNVCAAPATDLTGLYIVAACAAALVLTSALCVGYFIHLRRRTRQQMGGKAYEVLDHEENEAQST